MNHFTLFLGNARALNHRLLSQQYNIENTRTPQKHKSRTLSYMINLILSKSDFIQFLKHLPLFQCNHSCVRTKTSDKTIEFGEQRIIWKSKPQKTRLHDKLILRIKQTSSVFPRSFRCLWATARTLKHGRLCFSTKTRTFEKQLQKT